MADFRLFTGDFRQALDRLVGKLPEDFKGGLFRAAAELHHDSNTVEPKTPKLEGHLRGSWQIEASYTSPDEWELVCGFNIEYASYVHEMLQGNEQWGMVVHWSEPGSGPKFLESKLSMFSRKYMDIAVGSMRGEE